jgi:hypothetical protein
MVTSGLEMMKQSNVVGGGPDVWLVLLPNWSLVSGIERLFCLDEECGLLLDAYLSVCAHFLCLLSELSLATQKMSVLFSGRQSCAWDAQNCQSNYPPLHGHKATLVPVSDICKDAAQAAKT